VHHYFGNGYLGHAQNLRTKRSKIVNFLVAIKLNMASLKAMNQKKSKNSMK